MIGQTPVIPLTFDFRSMLPHETEDGEGLFYYHYAVRGTDG